VSIVICSLNGADGVQRCLDTLAAQKTGTKFEVIVVDDGSTDATSEVARRSGATLIRHETNRGLAASRNAGIRSARAEIVAFLDDDCEADPQWVENLLAAYGPATVGVGGDVRPLVDGRYFAGFLDRNNPLAPLELEISHSTALHYRLWLYMRTQVAIGVPTGRRAVNSLVGANMSFRRQPLEDVGYFDERFTFGGEELDLCWRLHDRFPDSVLIVEPAAVVWHRFRPGLRDTLRRGRAYGRGSARLFRKWPHLNPTVFPSPLVELALLAGAVRWRWLLAAALLWPSAAYPNTIRQALRQRTPTPLLDAYVRLAQEHQTNLGFLAGLREFRDLVPEPADHDEQTDGQRVAETIM
jgi:glycosyltransferase involved in cell wall biosynthesis